MPHFLVPTDFSEAACQALAAAVQLARPLEARITLLHAVELPAQADATPGVFVIKLLQVAKDRLQQLLRKAAQNASDTPIQTLIQVAPRRMALLAAITQQRPDVVFVAMPSGRGGRLSSTAEWLVRMASCPVLVVQEPLGLHLVRTVVFPTSFSARGLHAGPVLRGLLSLFPGAVLHVLHVSSAGEHQEELREQLALLVQELGMAKCERTIVAVPDLRLGIEHFAQQVCADVLVLRVGTAGLGWLWPGDATPSDTAPSFPSILTFRLDDEPVVEHSL